MAMILPAFIENFGTLVAKMAQDEVGALLGIPDEIENLGVTVRDIKAVLSDAETKQTKNSAIERWLLQLKDVMYDADDLMDLCQIKAEERRVRYDHISSSSFGCMHMPRGMSLLSCFHNPKFASEISRKIKQINARLDDIAKKKSTLGLRESQDVVSSFNVRRGNSIISRKTDPSVVLADIVGDKIEKDTELLVKWLTTHEMGVNDNISVVAVVGMGGIGKTTLAKKVFNDQRIKEEFNMKIWVCVSKDLRGSELRMLKCVIRAAGGDHGAAEERSELAPMLAKLVRGKKFLLVLDDVWPESQRVWDGLLRDSMMGGSHGSRLLVTTRDGRVAQRMNAQTHQVERLLEKDAWSLLMKQVSLDDIKSETLHLKDIGIELVKKCDGLPLAIKAIGGVLCMKDKTRAEWQTVLRSTLWSVDGLPSDIHHAFYLSYEDLPMHLKQCFIFCSLYPEDFVFNRSQLVYLWLAEGFLSDEGDLSFLEKGIGYYKELLLRNLLEASVWHYDQDGCKMHDLLRSFAEYLGNGDNFIMREGALPRRFESLLKLRRLSIEKHQVDEEFLNKEKYLRTLLFINNPMGEFLSHLLPLFSHLRIADLSQSKILSLSDSFCDLVHLRYLNVAGTKLKTLPDSIGKLRKLVYLSLGSCKHLSHVPSSIINLVQLRFLSLYITNVETFPMGLRKLEKLVELHGLKPDEDNSKGLSSLEDLGTMSQLSRLVLCSMEKASNITIAEKANLADKVHLKNLSFFYTPNQGRQVSISNEQKRAAENVINVLSPPPSLEILIINSYFGDHLPNWLNVRIGPSNLKFLRFLELSGCECFKQLPPLGQLPNLDLLRINSAISVKTVGGEFFWGDTNGRIRTTVHQPPSVPFPQLNELAFHRMSFWGQWHWSEGQPAMPKLKKLFLKACPRLTSLPQGLLQYATSLEFLDINSAKCIKSIENLKSVKDLRVLDNPKLERISNLPNLSFILIRNCPNLEVLENLKPFHRMELWDFEMETLPKYLMTTNPEKLKIWCRTKLLVKIASLEVDSSEWQKIKHIRVVKFYSRDESRYATYQKTPFSFITNVASKDGQISSIRGAPSSSLML